MVFGSVDESGYCWKRIIKSFLLPGLVIIALGLVIGGILVFTSEQKSFVRYRFNPEDAYVYTFHKNLFEVVTEGKPLIYGSIFPYPVSEIELLGRYERGELSQIVSRMTATKEEREGEKTRDTNGDYVFVTPYDEVIFQFHLPSQGSIYRQYPLADSVILQVRNEQERKNLNVTLTGYSRDRAYQTEQRSRIKSVTIESGRPFGKMSYFSSDEPLYVKSVKIGVKSPEEQESDGSSRIGVRSFEFYLNRDAAVRKLDEADQLLESLKVKTSEKKFQQAVQIVKETRLVDPYNPEIYFIFSEILLVQGKYDLALEQINIALDHLQTFGSFLSTNLQLEELYNQKAEIYAVLGKWDEAIETMKKAGYLTSWSFLARAYLRKFESGEGEKELHLSVECGVKAVENSVADSLQVSKIFNLSEESLALSIDYLNSLSIKPDERGKISLKYLGKADLFAFQLLRGILVYRWGSLDLFDRVLEGLNRIEIDKYPEEKKAIFYAVKCNLLREFESGEAIDCCQTALSYFKNYYSMYDPWIEFIER